MRAAIYARVSTERQGREQTIDSQLSALRDWVMANDHELLPEHVYTDQGYSGSRLDRPGLDRLRDAVHDGTLDVVAVLSPDRLARKYAYQALLLEEFRKAGCAIVFIQHPHSDSPHDQLLLQIQGAVAEYERAVLGERFRRGKLQKARAGHWIGGKAPYGYRYVPRREGTPGRLEIDEAEAELVRLLYRWLLEERMTIRQILKRLNCGPWRPRSGKACWSAAVVHRVLSDPLYTGTAYTNRYSFVPPAKPRRRGPRCGENTSRRPRPREEWIAIPIPPIIDPIMHEQAQEQLRRNAALSFRHNTRYSYLLRCLLTCRSCGLAMFGVTHRATARQPQRRYYKCHGKDCLSAAREQPCPQRMAKAEELEAAVWGHVRQLLSDPEALVAQFQSFAQQAEAGGARERVEAEKLQGLLRRLGREEERLLDAYQAGVISLDELGRRREQLRERRRALEEQHQHQERCRQQASTARHVLQDLTAFCERMRARLDDTTLEEQQQILGLLIERIVVGEDTLEIRHVIPLRDPPPDPERPSGPPPAEDRLRSDGVHPAALLLHPRPDLPHRLPEAPGAVADRQGRVDRQPPRLDVQEQFLPRLLALPLAVLDGDPLLLAVGGGPQQHQEALPAPFQANVEVDAVGPDVDVVLARQRSLAPVVVLLLPEALQPGDGGGRQPLGVRAQEGGEGLAEVARADPLEVQPGDPLLDALGLPQLRGQDRRAELLPLALRAPVRDAGLLDRDGSNPRADRPLGQVAVAHHLPVPVGVEAVAVPVDPVGDLGLDGRSEELLGARAEDLAQDIFRLGQWPEANLGGRTVHGGVLLCLVGTRG